LTVVGLAVGAALGVGGDGAAPTFKCFDTTNKLRDAVDKYLFDNSKGSEVASIYGFPIDEWCVGVYPRFKTLATSSHQMKNPTNALI
jgi:hypothetical protein